MIEVVGLGALNVDNILKVERLLKDEEAVAQKHRLAEYEDAGAQKLGLFPGGSAANTIYGLAKLGIETGFIGAIGDDAEGRLLLHDFQRVGVDTSRIKLKPGAKTGVALCLTDTRNFRSIHITPGANDLLTMDDADSTYINQAKMFHVTSFAGDRQFKLSVELLDKLDFSVKVSFSPGGLYASRGLQALTPILAKTYVLFVNEGEVRQLTGGDFVSGARRLLDLGCHIVVVTLGQGKAYKSVMATGYIRTAEDEYAVESSDKSIVSASDAIGAGDAFATGFLYGLLKGKQLEECGRLGNMVAQFSISEIGARQGLPNLNKLTKRYRELYNEEL